MKADERDVYEFFSRAGKVRIPLIAVSFFILVWLVIVMFIYKDAVYIILVC